MIINITIPPVYSEYLDSVSIYNLIKRNQEDLVKHIPNLQECHLEFSRLSGNPISTNEVFIKHTLTVDELSLKITVRMRNKASRENVVNNIAREIKKIKDIYY